MDFPECIICGDDAEWSASVQDVDSVESVEVPMCGYDVKALSASGATFVRLVHIGHRKWMIKLRQQRIRGMLTVREFLMEYAEMERAHDKERHSVLCQQVD